jgi:hypothetical protein
LEGVEEEKSPRGTRILPENRVQWSWTLRTIETIENFQVFAFGCRIEEIRK